MAGNHQYFIFFFAYILVTDDKDLSLNPNSDTVYFAGTVMGT